MSAEPLTPDRFASLAAGFPRLRVAVVGDLCLDRYWEIDPGRAATSIETGLPVHNVARVRAQPGGSGTVINNLVALGVGTVLPVGFRGDDGEGFELARALGRLAGVDLTHLVVRADRATPTYGKPLVVEPGRPPVELSRIDQRNWSSTPADLADDLADRVRAVAAAVDAVIVLDQVEVAGSGVVTSALAATLVEVAAAHPGLLVMADSRRGPQGWPGVVAKCNQAELAMANQGCRSGPDRGITMAMVELTRRTGRPAFVTLAERGMIGATPDGRVDQVAARPVRGPIDVVGAGDAVTSALTAILAAGGATVEAMTAAMAAASIVVHQVGTTGTASVAAVGAELSR